MVADRASILLFDEDGLMRFKAWRGLSDGYRSAVTGHSPWRKGELGSMPTTVPDVSAHDSLNGYRLVFEREGIRALAFIPLTLNTGVSG